MNVSFADGASPVQIASHRSPMGRAVIGAAAGIIASAAMNEFQKIWTQFSERQTDGGKPESRQSDEPATAKAADKVTQAVFGQPVPERDKEIAGNAVHYAFGALLGGIFGIASRRFPKVGAGRGSVYGAAVAVIADDLMVPAAGLGKRPEEVPFSVHLYGLASHLVFGIVLAQANKVLARRFR